MKNLVSDPENLLVVRNDRLGDTILALPTVPLLRNAFPNAQIHFWAAPDVAPLVRCVEGISTVIEGDDRSGNDVLEKIASLKIDVAFCLRPTLHNALMLKKARIPKRIGTLRRWYSPLFTTRINIHRHRSGRHEADLNLDLLKGAGITGETGFPEIELPESAAEKVEKFLTDQGANPDSPLIVIHPGSGGSAPDWPAEYFRQLGERFASDNRFTIVVTGSRAESELCRTVATKEHINLCGQTGLLELAYLLKSAEILVANSTGPLHLSVALGTAALGLYPPIADCLPDRWGPYGHHDWAIMPDLPICRKCRPGVISSCWCMEQLSPDRVYEHAMGML